MFWAPQGYPLLASHLQGAGPAGELGANAAEPLEQPLPLRGGGRVGVFPR